MSRIGAGSNELAVIVELPLRDAMLFNFRLRPLDQVAPWGGPDKATLHWFGLTDGEYWIKCGDDVVFGPIDYQVVRLHEDLLTLAPHALEPVPDDLRPYFLALAPACRRSGVVSVFRRGLDSLCQDLPEELRPYVLAVIKAQGCAEIEEKFNLDLHKVDDADLAFDLIERATSWAHRRQLDTSYLVGGNKLSFYSDAAHVCIAWRSDNNGESGTLEGETSFARATFIDELVDFHNRLMDEMASRVDAVMNGALSKHIHVNLAGLLLDQRTRQREIDVSLRSPDPPTDWDAVRAAIGWVEAASAGASLC